MKCYKQQTTNVLDISPDTAGLTLISSYKECCGNIEVSDRIVTTGGTYF